MESVMKRQHYKSNIGTSKSLIDVLPGELTLDANFVATRFDKRLRTVFDEATVVLLKDLIGKQVRSVLGCKPVRDISKNELFEELKDALKQIVYQSWKPDFAHVVLHSSGLDSRMLSWAIRELAIEHGEDWLGQVLFVCSKREAQVFKGIMQYEGWNEDQYFVPREEAVLPEYYALSLLDFDGAWKRAGGVSPIAVNLFWYPVMVAQQEDILPYKNVQHFNAQWGNTVMDVVNTQQLKEKMIMFYYSVLLQRPFKGTEVFFPFADCHYSKIIMSSKLKLGKKLRPELLASMDKRLAQFVNMNGDGDRHIKIADWIIEQMINDYDNSWYGKSVAPGARPKHKTTEFQAFWSRWTAASFCEHLRNSGYQISIRR